MLPMDISSHYLGTTSYRDYYLLVNKSDISRLVLREHDYHNTIQISPNSANIKMRLDDVVLVAAGENISN